MMKLPDAVPTKLDLYAYSWRLQNDQGYKCLGEGAFGAVFALGKEPEVIKVGRTNSDGYLQFVKYVGLRSSNPHLPYIRKLEIFDTDPDSPTSDPYYAVTMERLAYSPKDRHATDALRELGVSDLWDLHNPENITPKTRAANYVKQILKDLYRQYAADIKWGNVLFRDNTLVITDPVACFIG